ncbi:isoleucine--tRNA ligase [Bacteroidales bacterium OttesenSCG-928-C19]|nr:isoleucine--tRNA ligase [Bacteroidales bacterium OttesenSCG-928-C19]
MQKKYAEYKGLNLSKIGEDILEKWKTEHTFEKSLELSEGNTPFIFYEGPPSANGMPGIHHVMARAIKDIFCRYKTQKGFYVTRKAGWDCHGLPVELSVEKNLGITKEDIGKKISVDDYNKACRQEVMKYKDKWDELTKLMGYWVDLDEPYITFDNRYIETLWYLISELHKKGLLYKGYTIQPYSPAAGTGLSTHELNQPGCYRDVKDTTAVVQFKIKNSPFGENSYFLAWTTTPWTLPSNTALCVGPNIMYNVVKTKNPYNGEAITVVLAKDLVSNFFGEKKIAEFEVVGEKRGSELAGIEYEQLIPWVHPGKGAFQVITGDFVTTEDGTGIVHIAPTFGADDDRVAKQNSIPALLLIDKNGNTRPMVDMTGKFYKIEDLDSDFVKNHVNVELYNQWAGRFVKNAFDPNVAPDADTLDVDLCIMLKQQGLAFKIEKHTHNYPHCWRTDKPILYYPLDSWFIRTTAYKERLIELNKTINWKPEATGSGRFGNWLENLVDWNLSRSRYWGTPLPIWRTEDGTEEICIGSVDELRNEIEKSIDMGFMKENPYKSEDYTTFDLHRPYIDNIILASPTGKPMKRELDLIDVWFDSGAMPYAQYFYPKGSIEGRFPADFIAEGVDQTRGWFFTLHAIATMLFDSVAFKNVISNGLVLDKNGNKMSKRLGNGVDPFETIEKFGPDATRWYMISNSQPWDNLRFNIDGVDEVRRKFFGTLYNTYGFFALYANIDKFTYAEPDIAIEKRPEIDRWILSELNTLIKTVDSYLEEYEPTKASRVISTFVDEYLSNWYVRLCRRRFWKGDYTEDKISAYQTLYTCLETITRLMAPFAPFFSEQMFCDLNSVTNKHNVASVHHTKFPEANPALIDNALEERMQMAQKISSMVLSLRKRTNNRVRQPLAKIMIPVATENIKQQIEKVSNLILSEVNVKAIEFLSQDNNVLVKKIKPNFKTLGPKYGKIMKAIQQELSIFTQEQIGQIEISKEYKLTIENEVVDLTIEDVEIITQDIPGWVVLNEGNLTVALDVTVTPELKQEGIARELINRIQNIRKESDFDVTDKILVDLEQHEEINDAVKSHYDYICSETLTKELKLVEKVENGNRQEIDLVEETMSGVWVRKA